ncbi:Hypothetical predicted protein [Lecanosticta acicola]|uniref:Uncharacterized protein n=1 Tax=Lecanosticta acicola TaxID=111012 RepID=A0AAI9ECS2_9PEZI|nr:Hypothetical predicted protein [Lecanosticta acicola]
MPLSQNTPDAEAKSSDVPKPRRFAPEPIETTTKSSRTVRKHSPEKDTSTKVRRFAPVAIETTTKSSRKDDGAGNSKPAPRRFAPQPIETTQKSSKDRSKDTASLPHIRFTPRLVETKYGSNRKSSREDSKDSEDNGSYVQMPRKFTPVVLSIAKRSRRAGDSDPANYQDHRTEEGHLIHARELQKHAGWKTSVEGQVASRSDDVSHPSHKLPPGEARRQVYPHDGTPGNRPSALVPSRTHSFRCPDLDTIESSESERESGPSSMSCSPGQGSPLTTSDSSFNEYYKHATRIRESVDENFSHYLLQLEAKKAQQRLQEQALAAFPNSDFHEPVQHYVNDDRDSVEEEIEDRPVTWEGFDEEEYLVRVRRESTKTPWEQLEMQRHAEILEQERKANMTTAATKQEPSSPWWNPIPATSVHQPDSEMRSMRDRARPPMLGRDLRFPRCPSPEPARFDVTQGSDKLRQQMCYLSQQSQNQKTEEGGLWSAAPNKTHQQESMSSANSKGDAKSTTGKGLWGGFCFAKAEDDANTGLAPPRGPTGLMTPRPREDNANPFEQSFAYRGGGSGTVITPGTPPETDLNNLDAILDIEKKFEETFEREYPDSFITQVFNYLSLGYPSLARPFDEELSKISKIPTANLRQDDAKAKQSPKGYIRLDPEFEGDSLTQECVRWQALKAYIHEWARQEKNMVRVDAPGGNWATTNRRGSWAI